MPAKAETFPAKPTTFHPECQYLQVTTNGVTIQANKGQDGNPNVQDYALIHSASTLLFRVGNGAANSPPGYAFLPWQYKFQHRAA